MNKDLRARVDRLLGQLRPLLQADGVEIELPGVPGITRMVTV